MTTLTITVNGKKAGQLIYFTLKLAKSNFLKVVDMTFNSVEDVLQGEKDGVYELV
jgi:hypothetical protein